MAKFHEKAIILYGVSQIAENTSAILSQADSTGTLTCTAASTAVTGTGTAYLTQVTPGAYLYDEAGVEIAQVLSVESDTALTLASNAPTSKAGVEFSVGLGPKNALAALNMNYSTELTSEAFQYVGDELSRDEETVITDKYAKFDFETFMPKLGTIAGNDPVESEVPLADWMQSSGMAVELSALATPGSGFIKYTNSVSSNEYMTIEVRRSSPDIATEKTFTMTDCRGVVDLDGQVGTRVKLKFNYNGNLKDVTQKAKLTADFQQQKANTAPSLKSNTITLSKLVPYVTASEPLLGTETSNFCFDKITAPNVAGFEYDRFLTSCEDGWSKGGVPSDVSLTIIEDEAGATYNPDNELEKNNVLAVRYGATAGEKVELYFHKVQLANVSGSTVAKYVGQDLAYRNVGYTDIKIS